MISSTVYNLKHKDGLNQRVQQVIFDSLNEIEFLDLRCQIKKYKAKGFYIYYNGDKVFINSNGMLSKYVPIFIDSIYKYNYLLGIDNKTFK